MSSSTDISSQEVSDLHKFASLATESSQEVHRYFSTTLGKVVSWIKSKIGFMPQCVAHHIEIHQKLMTTVNKLRARGQENQIDTKIIQSLDESTAALRVIANKVHYASFLRAFLPDLDIKTQGDESRLLT